MNPRERLAQIEAELRRIHEEAGDAALNEEGQSRWDELVAERGQLEETIRRDDARRTLVRSLADRSGHSEDGVPNRGVPNTNVRRDPFELLETRGAGVAPAQLRRELVEANLRALEERGLGAEGLEQVEQLLRRHAGDTQWALQILARSHEDYASAWLKLVSGRGHLLTTEEQRAALAVGTSAQGGYLVPTNLDPTLILTNSGSSNVVRGLARVVTLTRGNTWNGVSTAGVTASWDAELAEVSDDTPTLAQPSVPLYAAQAFVQASFQMLEDGANNVESDVMMLFADARDRLEGSAHAVGTGSAQPTGIFTALDANTNVEITSTTAATIGLVDLNALYKGVPVRWRSRSTWVMNPTWALAIKGLGTALSASYTTDLTQAPTGQLLGRRVVESDDAPSTATTTALDPEIVLGDFSNFVIADKPGSLSISYVPHLFNTANNLPDGRSGWYMHWRNGSDSVNDLAFRLLLDKTSA